MSKSIKRTCPHCGNRNDKFIEDNNCPPRHYNYTLLCVARVLPRDAALADCGLADPDEDGKTACGMQWSPNA